jgi:nucleotide-binding universal stress UspA family protein
MYSKIIVGYDGSAQANDALALGKLIAGATGGSLTAVGVVQFDPRWGGRDLRLRDADAEFARQIEEAAAPFGVETTTVASSSPTRGLHDLAESTGADLVIVGSAHHGKAGQILAGNVGMGLLHGSPSSIAIAPHGYAEQTPQRIPEVTVGYDGSGEAEMALSDAIELARASNATLKLVTVAEPPPIGYGKGGGRSQGWHELKDEIRDSMRERLKKAAQSVPDDVRVEPTLVEGEPDKALAQIAVEDGGLLLLGSRAYGPLRRVLLGSVSTALVRSAPCPVIVHPRPAKEQAPTPEPNKAGSPA